MDSYDLVILGGSPLARKAAQIAGTYGRSVALIEPSLISVDDTALVQTLARSARVASTLRDAPHAGFTDVQFTVKFKELFPQTPEDFGDHPPSRLSGSAKFITPSIVEVGGRRITASHFLICTGSAPLPPSVPDLSPHDYFTLDTLPSLQALPKSLVLIGNDATTVSIAHAFKRLGSDVVIVSPTELLTSEDPSLVLQLVQQLKQDGVKILPNIRVERIERDGIRSILHVSDTAKKTKITSAAVLVVNGRQPRVDLGLETAGVAYDPVKGIFVDTGLRTNVSHIFAAGEVATLPQGTDLTPSVAIAIDNIFNNNGLVITPTLQPSLVYTYPELATIGLTERDLIDQHLPHRVVNLTFVDSSRLAPAKAVLKLLLDKDMILGASLLHTDAGVLLSPLVLAFQQQLSLNVAHAALAPTHPLRPVLQQVIGTSQERPGFFKRLFG